MKGLTVMPKTASVLMRSWCILIYWMSIIVFITSCKPVSDVKSEQNSSTYYSEKHRPQYHFTPEKNWMNDPNGLVYLNGEYHLFYQYYPDSNVWGPMHWGHAISSDLVFWKHLLVSLEPDSLGWIFSGSAVADVKNTSGLGDGINIPLIAFYTYHNDSLEKNKSDKFQYQGMAYSLDNGRTFKKYHKNPIVPNPGIRDFRDPKVIWYEPEKKWVMLLAAYDKIIFYQSKNLLTWEKTGEFASQGDKRLWECPDLFLLKDTSTSVSKWILLVSMTGGPNGGTATSYFVGDFDGKTFKGKPNEQKWLDFGTDNYALVTWSNVEKERRIAIGWMSNWQYAQVVPTQVWRSAMTLPRELRLYRQNDSYLVSASPIEELNALKKEPYRQIIDKGLPETVEIPELAYIEIICPYPAVSGELFSFENMSKNRVTLGFNKEDNVVYIDRMQSGNVAFHASFPSKQFSSQLMASDSLKLTMYLDKASLELMVNDQISMTQIFFPEQPFSKLNFNSGVGQANISISQMNGIWSKDK